jgi:glutathione-independent formaldehyde dehydrogenase
MKGLVYNGPREVTVSDVPDLRVDRPGDAITQIVRTNICGSDLHMYEGRTDMEPGRVRYQHFDARDQGWTKVVLAPAA